MSNILTLTFWFKMYIKMENYKNHLLTKGTHRTHMIVKIAEVKKISIYKVLYTYNQQNFVYLSWLEHHSSSEYNVYTIDTHNNICFYYNFLFRLLRTMLFNAIFILGFPLKVICSRIDHSSLKPSFDVDIKFYTGKQWFYK